MRFTTIAVIVVVSLTMLLTGSAPAAAQSWSPPPPEERCPSKWGAGDERGAANHMDPATVLKAARLIQTGRVIELGQVLRSDMPLGARHFDLYMKPTGPYTGSNRRGSNEELVVAEMGQVGTQFDGFTHQTIGDSLYNCVDQNDVMTRSGFTRLGVENVGTLMTRGVLIDVAALKGVDMLPDTYEITVDDLQQALDRQGVALEPGDAVLIHTGWGVLWDTDFERFMATNPGSASRRRSGSWSRIRCCWGPTTSRSRFRPTRTRRSRCRSTRSCWWSTASTWWSGCGWTSWPRPASTSSRSWCSR